MKGKKSVRRVFSMHLCMCCKSISKIACRVRTGSPRQRERKRRESMKKAHTIFYRGGGG